MNKNTLIITSEFPPLPGGIGNHALHLALQFQKNEYEVTVVTDQRSKNLCADIDFDTKLDVKVVRIKRKNPAVLTYINRIQKTFSLIRKNQIIIASGKFPLWMVAFMSLFFPAKKFVAVLHGSELGAGGTVGKLFTKWSLKKYDKLVAVSNFTKQLALERQPKGSITVINNGFAPKNTNTILKQKETQLSIITVGNVTSRKGQQNVIKALPLILSKYPDIRYHIVGLPTEKAAFLELAKQLKVESFVVFHGALSNEELHKKLCASNVFLMLSDHLSNGDVEGFGIAVLEANDVYLPAIGSKNSGIADAIKDGVSGKLVDPNSPEEILEALEVILADYENYAVQAKKWSEKFHWENVIQDYLNEVEK